MRDFCKFSPEFWSSTLAEQLKKLGRDALLLATYLQTNRHSNMLGAYFLPLAYMSYDTGIPLDILEELLDKLGALNFCHYDHQYAYVWVVELGLVQTGGPLKEQDKRVIQLRKQYEALPMVSFIDKFYEKYHSLYHLMVSPNQLHPELNPIDGSSMGLRSKKKYKKKENKNNKEKENNLVSSSSCEESDPLAHVFEHWKQTMGHPQANLDDKRKKTIQQAFKAGYGVEQLCQAITGCSYTPHNMGENDRSQRFDGLHVILRDADQIDRFIRNCHTPPRLLTKSEQVAQRNIDAVQSWINENEGVNGAL